MATKPSPFTLHVPDADIADLRDRLARSRFPDQAPGDAWAYGTDVAYLRELTEYWRTGFDWRAEEAGLNAFPQFRAPLDGIDLHYLHVPGVGPDPMPLLLLHGWPGSVFEFLEFIPRLTDPARFGGDARDAFTVVAPSLPGYGLSFRPGQKRFDVPEMADCVATLMHDVLGYTRFGAQGGDWGAAVTSRLGYAHKDRMIGIHINLMLAAGRDPAALPIRPRRSGVIWATLPNGRARRPVISGSRARVRRRLPSLSPIRPWAWLHGSWRNSAPGPIAAARSNARSAGIACSPISRSTGSPGQSAHRSGRTMPGCTVRRSCPPATRSRYPPATRNFRAKFLSRRVPPQRVCSPTFAAGVSCPRVDISPRWNSRSYSPMRCAPFSGNCDEVAGPTTLGFRVGFLTARSDRPAHCRIF
jgi:pimeloyl-ACP methyl ester carboxylesterase